MNEYESRSALKVVDERIASPRPNRGRCEGARFPRLARLLHRMRANHITVFCASEVGHERPSVTFSGAKTFCES